jgi:hypothetical protein
MGSPTSNQIRQPPIKVTPARRFRSPSVRGIYPQASALKIAYEAAAIGAAPRT